MSESKMAQARAEVKDGTAHRGLITKLVAVMAAVDRVAKRGVNEFHKYSYATEADIAEEVRKALIAEGLIIIPNVLKTDWQAVQGKSGTSLMCILEVEFTVTDGQEERKFVIVGSGLDSGDKGPYKAMTGAEKYALLKLFLIPTGDDPERDGDDKKQARRTKTQPTAPPKPTYETITPDQAKHIWAMAGGFFPKDELAGRMKTILGAFKVERTPDLPADRYQEVLDALAEIK